MIITRENAIGLFVELGFVSAKTWSDERLATKFNKLPELVADADTSEIEGEQEELLDEVLKTLDEGGFVDIDSSKEKKPEVKKTVKKKSKKKSKVVEEEPESKEKSMKKKVKKSKAKEVKEEKPEKKKAKKSKAKEVKEEKPEKKERKPRRMYTSESRYSIAAKHLNTLKRKTSFDEVVEKTNAMYGVSNLRQQIYAVVHTLDIMNALELLTVDGETIIPNKK